MSKTIPPGVAAAAESENNLQSTKSRAPKDLPAEVLAEALLHSAKGILADEAAVQLLVAHGTWIRRPDFRTFVQFWPADCDGPDAAAVDWFGAARVFGLKGWAATSSAIAVLGVACSLADHHPAGFTLADLFGDLGQDDLTLVFQALAHARGWHQHDRQAVITGVVCGGAE